MMTVLVALDGGNTSAPAPRRPVSKLFHSELTVVPSTEVFHPCRVGGEFHVVNGREYRVVKRDACEGSW